MLTLYRRHNPAKCKYTKRDEKRCACPIWVVGWANGKKVPRKALKGRMWGEAEREVEEWLQAPEKRPLVMRSVSVPLAVEKYLVSCRVEKGVADSTYGSYSKTLEHLKDFLADQKVETIGVVTADHIRGYLETRSECKPRTRRKELEHIRFLFNHCEECEWINKNPTRGKIKPIRVKVPRGGAGVPFTDAEIQALVKACDQITNNNMTWVPRARLRAKALVLGMCYTGLRISDMVTLKRSDISQDGTVEAKVIVKTKQIIWTQFGQLALEAMLAVPREGDYFFWSGDSKMNTATGSARRTLYTLQRITGIKVHPHRFRDTFSMKQLDEHGDIRILQFLLGHTSVKTTEASYAFAGAKHKARLQDSLLNMDYGLGVS